MIAISEALGVAAKVSGAGGGDSVLAFSSDPEQLDAVARAWEEEGFVPLPVIRSEKGLRRV